MKILLFNQFLYPHGGDCINTIQLKQLLEEQGWLRWENNK
jgi:hypothetical protein